MSYSRMRDLFNVPTTQNITRKTTLHYSTPKVEKSHIAVKKDLGFSEFDEQRITELLKPAGFEPDNSTLPTMFCVGGGGAPAECWRAEVDLRCAQSGRDLTALDSALIKPDCPEYMNPLYPIMGIVGGSMLIACIATLLCPVRRRTPESNENYQRAPEPPAPPEFRSTLAP